MDKEKHRREFWDSWASKADESGQHIRFMLGIDDLDEANKISRSDIDEVVSLLPSLAGKDVLELGSGIGRFTPSLASKAKSLVSTDFTESFVEENKRVHGPDFPNVTFQTLDATKAGESFQPDSFDCIFFTWLLAYLTDEEVRKCAAGFLKILRPGGYLFFRETHFTHACSCDTSNNAGDYRSVKEFRDLFKPARFVDDSSSNGGQFYFQHLFSVNSKTYTKYRKLPTLINYLWRKSRTTDEQAPIDTQLDIDDKVYHEDCLKVYSQVFAEGFSMPGGLEGTKEWLSLVNIKPNSVILDAGCGSGGLMALLLKEYNVADATGVDLSMLACEAALLRLADLQTDKGCVMISDLSSANFPANSFDVILMKDSMEFMNNKKEILVNFWKWLKPSGQVLFGGYFKVQGQTIASSSLLHQKVYLSTKEDLQQGLRNAGFVQLSSTELSSQFVGYIETDLKKLQTVENVPVAVKKSLSDAWTELMAGLKDGRLEWVSLSAVKEL